MTENEFLKLCIKYAIEAMGNGKLKKAKDTLKGALAATDPITQGVDDAFVAQLKNDYGIG